MRSSDHRRRTAGSLLVHAHGALGLVEEGLVLVGVLLAGSLVGHLLGGRLLGVRDSVTAKMSV